MATFTITGQVKLRNDTAANWTSENPVLSQGEMGIETDTLKAKVGDGTTAWNSLGYAWGGGTIPTISTGSANGTISVNGTNVAVKGLGSAAYQADSYFVKKAGDTLTGTLTAKGSLCDTISQNTTAATPTGGGLDMNNSDITRANAIIWADQANNAKEGILFPNSGFSKWDSIWADGAGNVHADSYDKTTGTTTVRYIPKASANSKGNTNTPVYLTNGFLEPCTDLKARYDINGTEISSKNNQIRTNLGDPSLLEVGAIDTEFGDRLEFIPKSKVLYEYSIDGGSTWQELPVSDAIHKNLWGGTSMTTLSLPKVAGTTSSNYKTIDVSGEVNFQQFRMTVTQNGYVFLNLLYLYCGGQGSTYYFKLEFYHNTNGWETINETDNTTLGWPTHLTVKHGNKAFSSSASQYGKFRITIIPRTTGGTKTEGGVTYAQYWNYSIYKIRYLGGYPYQSCHVYSIDGDKNFTFPANVSATKFIGGLSVYPSARPTSANTRYGDGLLRYYLATSSMTTGRPPSDAMILHMGWDNTGGYDSQLAIGTSSNNKLYYRNMNGGTAWNEWKTVVTTDDLSAVATSGSYSDLSNKPTIPTVPTNISAFTNDSGYITSAHETNNNRNVEYIVGTQTAATGAWKGVTQDTELYDGKLILYFLPHAGSGNATLELTFPDETTTGAIPVYLGSSGINGTRMTTQINVKTQGAPVLLAYDGKNNIWCAMQYWTDANTYDRTLLNDIRVYAGTNKIMNYSLIMEKADGTWESCTTTSGTGTSKTKNTSGFRLGKIWVYNYNETIASGSLTRNDYLYDCIPHTLTYSTNCGTTLVARKPVYLVGTIGNDGLFYLDNTWWTQTEPSTEDGKVYVYLGNAYSTSAIYLVANNFAYEYRNGAFRLYSNSKRMTTSDIDEILSGQCYD